MWPWEHLALGYLLFSAYSRLKHHQPPPEGAIIVLAVGTQLPDLVDKPLAWTFGVLPGGTTLAHSVFTTVPLVLFVLVLARRFDRLAYGEAFGIGYCSHLLGDVLYPLLTDGEFSVGYLLWPVLSPRRVDTVGLAASTRTLFDAFVVFLSTTRGTWYLVFELVFLGATVMLWLRDGRPGVMTLRAVLAWLFRSQ